MAIDLSLLELTLLGNTAGPELSLIELVVLASNDGIDCSLVELTLLGEGIGSTRRRQSMIASF